MRARVEVGDVGLRYEDLEFWADSWGEGGWEGEDWAEPRLGDVLRESLHEDYAGAGAEAYDDALGAVLDGMSPAEALNFTKTLQQIQRDAGRALANPLAGRIGGAALPLGAGALGTLIGGPAGTAVGSRLGTLAAGALAGHGQPTRGTGAAAATGAPAGTGSPAGTGAPAGTGQIPARLAAAAPAGWAAAGPPAGAAAAGSGVAGGSAAATQAAVLAEHPAVRRALVALSLGLHGARQVDGVPVASIMNLLSSVFGQAAADADELSYLEGEGEGEGEGAESEGLDGGGLDGEGLDGAVLRDGFHADLALGTGRSLYTAFMDAENEELAR